MATPCRFKSGPGHHLHFPAAYACERYQVITGYPAPVIAGKRQADKALDKKARIMVTILAQELGHNRTDVVAAYIGSSK